MESQTLLAEQTAVIILAAGKGTRMGSADRAKVCFEIDGVPAINRQIKTFKKKKFKKFVLVTGYNAEQVMNAVSSVQSGIIFVYQNPQLGTGHAAKLATEALQNIGHKGPILTSMGDKYLEEEAIDLLTDEFIRKQADFALLTFPRTKKEGAMGRVLIDSNNRATAIVEKIDVARQAIADELLTLLQNGKPIAASQINALINHHIPEPKKQQSAIPELTALAKDSGPVSRKKLEEILSAKKYNLSIDGQRYTAKIIERKCTRVNPSLYLSTAEAFYHGIRLLDNDNAQGEYYLTDIVGHLAGLTDAAGKNRYKVIPVAAAKHTVLQGFNSPDELLTIQDYIRRKKMDVLQDASVFAPAIKKSQYTSVRQWITKIKTDSPALKRYLAKIYGNHEDLWQVKRKDILNVLNCYGKRFGFDQDVLIVRAPGRVNLMGRHVDHRGGCNNFLAIDRESIMVAGRRKDDHVVAVNTQPKRFKSHSFSLSEIIGQFGFGDWVNFVNSDWVRDLLRTTAGDWCNYIKAAMLRLQHQYGDLQIKGMNLALSGNIPMAAGLSSSSSIVVATLQAAIALNGLELEARQFVDLCGEGEWFVGSRGGSGDHAAIYLGQRGKIANVGYLPFRVNKMVDTPVDYQVLIADSHIKAAKSAAAKSTFNSKICGYNLGLELLKQRCPEFSSRIEYLRDVTPDRLGCSTSDIYRCLQKVPQYMTREDFRVMLPGQYRDQIESNFSTHDDPGAYNVRGVLLFGIAEILRSIMAVSLFDNERIEEFGNLMKISHNGDRISCSGEEGQYKSFKDCYTDQYLEGLIADLHSENPQRVLKAQLYMQPGYYACSTKDIDQMVDLVCSVPGVAGAQIAGAGLGGCIMILAKKQAIHDVGKILARQYYAPRTLKPAVIPCITTEGAGVLEF